MDIVAKLNGRREKFENIKGLKEAREREIQQMDEELRLVQGEYRMLIELGKEMGILDNEGNPIQRPEVVNEEPVENNPLPE